MLNIISFFDLENNRCGKNKPLNQELLETRNVGGSSNGSVFCFSGYSDVFATCSVNEIRVWNTCTSKELLRITVPNMTCNAIDFMRDGKSIVSGTY